MLNAGNGFPVFLCGGSVDATSGAMVVNSNSGIAAASIARTSKGLYTITLIDKPATATLLPILTPLSANTAVASGGYVPSTGVFTVTATDLANALAEAAFSFEFKVFQND